MAVRSQARVSYRGFGGTESAIMCYRDAHASVERG